MEKQSLLAEYDYDKLVSQAMVKFDIIGASYKTKYKVFFFLTAKTDHFELNLLWTQSE